MAKKQIVVDIISDVIWPFCWVGKRHLEQAMAKVAGEMEFKIRWLPYELQPGRSEEPGSKVEAYMKKFGRSKEEVNQMAAGMAQRFAAVGLPFTTSESARVSGTYTAHRVQTAAFLHGGQEAQDKCAEVIFNGYFGEGRAPSDPALLTAACAAAGMDAGKVLGDRSVAAAELEKELKYGRQVVSSGVPHFIVKGQNGGTVEFSGAQPPDDFIRAFSKVAGR